MEVKKTKKSGTVIALCNCINAYQDNLYGKNMRVKNVSEDGALKCTVCHKKILKQ